MHKFKQVRFRYLKKRLEAELRQAPGNCRYNVNPPPYGDVAVPPALCLYGAEDPTTWVPRVCDERVDKGECARACGTFCPRRTKEEIKEDFRVKLSRMTLPEVAFNYPDMAALLWVLDLENGMADGETSDPEPEVAPEPTPVSVVLEEGFNTPKVIPWYRRILGGS